MENLIENNNKINSFMGLDLNDYHENWNSLMLVLEKIEDLDVSEYSYKWKYGEEEYCNFTCFEVDTTRNTASIYMGLELDPSIKVAGDYNKPYPTKKEAVYNCILEFIDWYNDYIKFQQEEIKIIYKLKENSYSISEKKILYFEYILGLFHAWFVEKTNREPERHDLQKLKISKLLFLLSATQNDEGSDLLDVFNSFYTMINGPLDGDLQNMYHNVEFSNYILTEHEFDKIDNRENPLPTEDKELIDSCFKKLREFNDDLITTQSFTLVDYCSLWTSFKTTKDFSNELPGNEYKIIPTEMIRNDRNKLYKYNSSVN